MVESTRVALSAASPESVLVDTYVFPASFAQQRIWFLEQLDPGRSTYNIRHLYRMQGTLDAQRLEASINKVIARHESLRTRFVLQDGAPVQVIHSQSTLRLGLVDTTALAPNEREAEALRLSLDDLNHPFDL